jgi:hypothetical protein
MVTDNEENTASTSRLANEWAEGPTASRGPQLAVGDIDLTEDLLDWGPVLTVQGGEADDHGTVINDEENSTIGPNILVGESNHSEDPLDWGPVATCQGGDPEDLHVPVGDVDMSMLSLEELTELEERRQNEGRQLRIALLIKERDRRKAVWELGNKALMKVESLIRMMKMDEDADEL